MDRQWIILFIVLAITLFYPKGSENQKKTCIRLAAIAMILFAGLRSWWYGDLTKYYHGYLDAWELSFGEIFEERGFRNVGIEICFKIMSTLFGKYGYDIFIFIVSWFSIWTISKLVERFSPSPYYSFLMFICMGLYAFTFSGLKQTIAMGFCCLAMIELLDGTFLKFILFTILGALFHSPALLFLLAWPISRKRIDWSYFFFLALLLLIVYVLRDRLAYFLESAYYSAERADEIEPTTEAVGGKFLMMVFILVGAIFLRPPSQKDLIYSRVYGVMGLAAIFQMFSVYSNNYTRLADYFFQFVIIFTPLMLENYRFDKNRHRRVLGPLTNVRGIYLLAGLAVTVFSLWFYSRQISGMQNYYFFWEFDAHKWYGA